MKRILSGLLVALLASVAVAAPPTCVVGSNKVAPVASISFVAPTLQSDGTALTTAVTYNIYQGTASGAEVKVASGVGPNSPVTVTTGLTSGETVYWYLTAVDASGEGAPSNEVCKQFPAAVPGTFVITIT
jgi:hypothetical protein